MIYVRLLCKAHFLEELHALLSAIDGLSSNTATPFELHVRTVFEQNLVRVAEGQVASGRQALKIAAGAVGG